MRLSTINLVNSLKNKLLEFPQIVNCLEKKDISFIEKVFFWIKQTEEIFSTYNISEVSELAGVRSKILTPKYSDMRSISVKKSQLSIASQSLYELQHTVLNVLHRYDGKLEECRELVRQLLLIVSQTHTIQYNSDLPFDQFINELWQFINTNEQLKAGAVRLRTVLIMDDIRILIAEEVNVEDFVNNEVHGVR
ncbi:MAG: hypothetical protein HY960_10625 [Ignavibacteriae bacterium]|nr:hypothetical protein [Ignavibacteriota bacterium]